MSKKPPKPKPSSKVTPPVNVMLPKIEGEVVVDGQLTVSEGMWK